MKTHRVAPGTMPKATRRDVAINACDLHAVQHANIPLRTAPRFNGNAPKPRSTGGCAFVYEHANTHGFHYPGAFRTAH